MQITEKTSVEDLLAVYPHLAKVFVEFGLPCYVCGEAFWGTIEELAQRYNVDTDRLIKVLKEKTQESE